MISPTRDECFQTDTADRTTSRDEVCDRCGDCVRVSEGTAIPFPGTDDEGWVCFLCADQIAECDECNRTVAKCSCGVSLAHEYQPEDDYDPSDGDYDWSDCAEE